LKLSLVLAIQEVEKTGSKFIWLLGMFTWWLYVIRPLFIFVSSWDNSRS
jgi:hypothetical protein